MSREELAAILAINVIRLCCTFFFNEGMFENGAV